MWWVPTRYQVCVSNSSAYDDVILNWPAEGFHRRRMGRREAPGGYMEAALVHFQEWKKAYAYGWVGGQVLPRTTTNGVVLM
jgi:hypothetical protein